MLDENKEGVMREQLLPWLVEESCKYLKKQEKIQSGADRLCSVPSQVLLDKHRVFLKQEADRLQKIEEEKIAKAKRKAIKRAEKAE